MVKVRLFTTSTECTQGKKWTYDKVGDSSVRGTLTLGHIPWRVLQIMLYLPKYGKMSLATSLQSHISN